MEVESDDEQEKEEQPTSLIAEIERDCVEKVSKIAKEFIEYSQKLKDPEFEQSEIQRLIRNKEDELSKVIERTDENGNREELDLTNPDHQRHLYQQYQVFNPYTENFEKPDLQNRKWVMYQIQREDVPFPLPLQIPFSSIEVKRLKSAMDSWINLQILQTGFIDFPIYTSNLILLLIGEPMNPVNSAFNVIALYLLIKTYIQLHIPKNDGEQMILEWLQRDDAEVSEKDIRFLKATFSQEVIPSSWRSLDQKTLKRQLIEKITQLQKTRKEGEQPPKLTSLPQGLIAYQKSILEDSARQQSKYSELTSQIYENSRSPTPERSELIKLRKEALAKLQKNRSDPLLHSYEDVKTTFLNEQEALFENYSSGIRSHFSNFKELEKEETKKSLINTVKTTTRVFIQKLEVTLQRLLVRYIPQEHWSSFITADAFPTEEEVHPDIQANIVKNNIEMYHTRMKLFGNKAKNVGFVDGNLEISVKQAQALVKFMQVTKKGIFIKEADVEDVVNTMAKMDISENSN